MADNGSRGGPAALRALGIVLRPAPVLTVVATAAILAAALRTVPFGIPLVVMVASWNARHSIATLDSLGMGAREVPVLSLEMIQGTLKGWRSFLAMLFLVGLLFATGAAAFWIGPVAAIAAGALAALVLPLALLILGWTNNFTAALDPWAWVRVARVLGRDFVQLEAVGLALVVAVVGLLSSHVHALLVVRIAAALLGWLLLVVLAGLTIHARRGHLARVLPFYAGIEVGPSPAEIARRRQHAIDAIYALWRNGAHLDTWRAVEQQAGSAPSRDEELQWIYGQSLGWDAAALSARIAKELIHLHLLAARSGYALRLAREQLAMDRQFRPGTAHETLELARLAARFAEPAMALALIEGFDRLTADVSLLAAAAQLREELQSINGGRRP